MNDDWLRADPRWFNVDLIPADGIRPETKQGRKAAESEKAEDPQGPRRRSLTAERRRKALERKERKKKSQEES